MDEYDFREHDREVRLLHRPTCDVCGEHIQGDGYYDIDGKIICEDCIGAFFVFHEVD